MMIIYARHDDHAGRNQEVPVKQILQSLQLPRGAAQPVDRFIGIVIKSAIERQMNGSESGRLQLLDIPAIAEAQSVAEYDWSVSNPPDHPDQFGQIRSDSRLGTDETDARAFWKARKHAREPIRIHVRDLAIGNVAVVTGHIATMGHVGKDGREWISSGES